MGRKMYVTARHGTSNKRINAGKAKKKAKVCGRQETRARGRGRRNVKEKEKER